MTNERYVSRPHEHEGLLELLENAVAEGRVHQDILPDERGMYQVSDEHKTKEVEEIIKPLIEEIKECTPWFGSIVRMMATASKRTAMATVTEVLRAISQDYEYDMASRPFFVDYMALVKVDPDTPFGTRTHYLVEGAGEWYKAGESLGVAKRAGDKWTYIRCPESFLESKQGIADLAVAMFHDRRGFFIPDQFEYRPLEQEEIEEVKANSTPIYLELNWDLNEVQK